MPQLDLLRQLADHLETGLLGHQEFYFGFFNSGYSQSVRSRHSINPRLKHCNKSGCGVGECPFVFPDWRFDFTGQPIFGGKTDGASSAQLFFQLDHWQYEHLFVPDQQDVERYGGEKLNKMIEKEVLAAHIRHFCELMDP